MANEVYGRIVRLVREASEIARTVGIDNLLQPGLVKEMIIADILGHELIVSKRDADARDPNNPDIVYEYLSCKEGGSGQVDRMFKVPPEKREQSLNRIWRNDKIFLVIFYSSDQTRVKSIYELEPSVVAAEAERRLDSSQNDISHVNFSEKWARENGKIVYENGGGKIK